MVKEISENEVQQEVIESPGKTVVDFYATWCGPCKMLAPIVEQISEEYTDVKFVKVNVDDAQNTAAQYDVASIPTLVTIENGKEVVKSVGVKSKDQLIKALQL